MIGLIAFENNRQGTKEHEIKLSGTSRVISVRPDGNGIRDE